MIIGLQKGSSENMSELLFGGYISTELRAYIAITRKDEAYIECLRSH